MRRIALFSALLFGCSEQAAPAGDAGAAARADAEVGSGDASIDDGGAGPLACTPMLGPDEACGGTITGTWRYVDLCGLPKALSDFLANCPAARITANDHVVTGSVAWNADQTYEWMLSDEFGIAMEVPVDCTASSGGCEAFGLLVTIAAGETVTCMQRDQLCECFSIGTRDDAQDGIFDATDGTITTTRASDGKRREYYYCVREDRALLRRTDEGIVLLLER